MAEALPVIAAEALTDRAAQSLRDAIVEGRLRPGQRLVEVRLASQMGVSRAPVREALRILEREGLVTSRPRRGVSVTVLSKHDVQEIYGLRSALECQAARNACKRITPPDVEELLSLIRAMKRAGSVDDRKLLARRDLAFHQKILEMSGNRRLLQAWLGIMTHVRLLQRHVLTSEDASVRELARRHETIVNALRSSNPNTAERCMRDHIERKAHAVFESFPDSDRAAAHERNAGRL